MKQLILLLLAITCGQALKAQEATTDYIYSSDGFEVKTAVFTDDRYTYQSTGLYSSDGKMLVMAMESYRDYIPTNTFLVLDGCETICSGAFQALYNMAIYIPSSVKSIAPDAFTSKVRLAAPQKAANLFNKLLGVQDGATEQSLTDSARAPKTDSDTGHSARFNLRGQKLASPSNGINIIQNPDGSTEKLLIN